MQFIKLLTNDDSIVIGHDAESETFEVNTSCYYDKNAGLSVTLVDTPGFHDSRNGVTDTDILEEIARFLLEGRAPFNFRLRRHQLTTNSMVSSTCTESPTLE